LILIKLYKKLKFWVLIFDLFCYIIAIQIMIKLRVYAKLNLALNVLSCEQDGYHQLDMVNQSISLFDEIRIVPRPDNRISVHCDKNIGVINTALTSASEFVKKFDTCGYDITIKKGIPMKGGLGGSSADAAGVLSALAKYHNIDLKEVYPIADKIGSDVKYMMSGGLARVTGKGEMVELFDCNSLFYFVVVIPPFGLSTRKVFEEFDKNPDFTKADNEKLLQAVINEDENEVRANLFNGLQKTAFKLEPKLSKICDEVSKMGVAQMTGSGSCLYMVVDTLAEAEFIVSKLNKTGCSAVVAESRKAGIEYLEMMV